MLYSLEMGVMRNPANIVQRVRHDQPSPLDEIATPLFTLLVVT